MWYEDQCQVLKWPTALTDHRIYLSLVEFYKIIFGSYHLKSEDFSNWPQPSLQELTDLPD